MGGGWRLGPLGGHLGGPAVSALVDGQLDDESAERAWSHVMGCAPCRRAVEREGWVKRQLAQMSSPRGEDDVPDRLLGNLYDLDPLESETRAAWAAVGELEERSRGRRRAGLAAVGVGSVSAAVLGFTALSGSTLGIGGSTAPSGPSPSALTRSTPTAGPLAQLGGAGNLPESRARRSTDVPTGATAPSSFVPFSGWSISAPVSVRASAVAVASPR
jgi:hypothetical protein